MEVEGLETIQYLNHAIDYIEENIDKPLEVDEIAKVALLSRYHFQRIFHVLTGFTLAEYIRNRKLTLAAEELILRKESVTEIAFKYGYESVDAFTKAFRRLHGVTPSAVRKGTATIKLFPRLSLQLDIRGRDEMNYHIVEKDEWDMIGIEMQTTSKNTVEQEITAFCDRVWIDGSHHKLNEFLGYPIMHMLDGVHFDFKEDGSRKYMLGWETPKKEIPKIYKVLHIPACCWIVFEHRADMRNKGAINELWKRIYTDWISSTCFEQIEGPCIERYFWEDDAYYKYRCEVWIPVKKKVEEDIHEYNSMSSTRR